MKKVSHSIKWKKTTAQIRKKFKKNRKIKIFWAHKNFYHFFQLFFIAISIEEKNNAQFIRPSPINQRYWYLTNINIDTRHHYQCLKVEKNNRIFFQKKNQN